MSVLCIRSPLPEPGSGVFETILVVGGKPLELEHTWRVCRRASRPCTAVLCRRTCASGCSAPAPMPTWPGCARPLTPDGEGTVGLEVLAVDIDEAIVFPSWERGVELVAVRCPAGSARTSGPTGGCSSRPSATPAGASPLMLDADDTLLEGSRGSLFLVRDGVLLDPAGRRAAAAGRHAGPGDRAGRRSGHRGAARRRWRSSACSRPTRRS